MSATWTCDCGETSATIPTKGTGRAVCYCRDCQAFALLAADGRSLDAAGGSDLILTTPGAVTITKGDENLRCLRLSDKGPIRWYTACCGAPMSNVLGNPKLPYASLTTRGFKDQSKFGPVRLRTNRKEATQRVTQPKGSLPRTILSVIRRGLTSRITGKYRTSPFFNPDGKPSSDIRSPTAEERARIYPTEDNQLT
ncbi:MAG: hypothetical protein GKR98_16840 [Boseongicola sp.]|nr:MAG: hypothetical protein GKR98_16840 [Boseongicola sp.]